MNFELMSILPEIPKEHVYYFIGAMALVIALGKHDNHKH